MALSLLPISPAKAVLLVLAGVAILAFLWVGRPDAPLPSVPTPHAESPPERRGDDPTYADELKKMTALLQDMRYQFSQTENKRILDRDQAAAQVREATERAIRSSREEVERLNAALNDAKAALDLKIKEAAAAPASLALQADVNRLRAELEALRARAQAPDPATAPAPAPDSRPEANRILAAPDGTRPNDTAPGPLQIMPGMPGMPGVLDTVRGLPGLDGLIDPQAVTRPTPGSAAAGVRGLPGEYVAITPYGRDEPRAAQAAAAATTAATLAPKRYPFTVNPGREGATAIIPVYTLPDTATLVDNSTMTPLVGRVPFRGSVRDPFRFKLITGATNLATNGHRIPGIQNAVWTGYAVGVREQSCVRAYIDTVTFTFTDGRLHTVRKGKGNTETAASVNDNLGYLTDPWGKPCIRGRYFANAGSYLRDRGIAAFLDGLANAYAASQVTTVREEGGGLTSFVTGDTYAFALGRGVGQATGEIADYVAERAEGAFDVIYVPSGINVQVFVEAQIPIDYNTQGRKISYDYSAGDSHARLD